MIVDCAVYDGGARRQGALDVHDALESIADGASFVWIGLSEPTMEEFADVGEELSLHALAVEDAVRAHQRPKLEIYDDTVFAVVKTASYHDTEERIDFGEIHVFVKHGSVVTVRHGELSELRSVRERLEHDPTMLARGPSSVLWAVLDKVVDDYELVLDGIEIDIEQIEQQIFASPRGVSSERIFRLKREVLQFQRILSPLEDALRVLVRGATPTICSHPELSDYFRDVLDHSLRIASRVDVARETLGAALDANLAQISLRQNEDMRAISGWAAVIAVPTLLAGIWGMNFDHMPELHSLVGYPIALTTIVASGLLVRWKLAKNGWL